MIYVRCDSHVAAFDCVVSVVSYEQPVPGSVGSSLTGSVA